NCSCGDTMHDCNFWKRINIEEGKLLCISYSDFFYWNKLKRKVNYNKKIYDRILNDCLSKYQTDNFCLIDNSKHPLRAFILAISCRKEFDVKVFYTRRPAKEILNSFKKRKNKKRKSRLHRNLWLFYPAIMLFRLVKLMILCILNLYGISVQVVSQKNRLRFIRKNKEDFKIEKHSLNKYQLKEFINHYFGGSKSSEGTLLKF